MKLENKKLFKSIIGPLIYDFIAEKRSLGALFETEAYSLRLLDQFVYHRKIKKTNQLTPVVIDQFIESRQRRTARSYNHLRSIIKAFFERLVRFGVLLNNPVQIKKRRKTNQYVPFIFSPVQVAQLLNATKNLPKAYNGKLRSETFYTIFAILYGLGLRVGEAQRLIVSDIDFSKCTILIRESKFGKSRILPFGPKIEKLLKNYLNHKKIMNQSIEPKSMLFSIVKGAPVSRTTIKKTFRKMVTKLNFKIEPGVTPPRLHHLRHSFAVGRLLRWYRSDVDVSQRLYALSTFLGHVDPTSTQVYLTMTEELLTVASKKFESFSPAVRGVK
jgi:site-specific recombinase XerD